MLASYSTMTFPEPSLMSMMMGQLLVVLGSSSQSQDPWTFIVTPPEPATKEPCRLTDLF